MTASITDRAFGRLSDGRAVQAYRLCCGPMQAEVLTLGATLRCLMVPDREGRPADTVLGFDDADAYTGRGRYFGATIGRVAGRLTGAAFALEGQCYRLPANDGANHLHGGAAGFQGKVWTAEPHVMEDAAVLRLTCTSASGDGGYPGRVAVTLEYQLRSDGLTLHSEATTDTATPLSMTHHSYFNLGGPDAAAVTDHEVAIFADETVAADEDMTLLGRLQPVDAGNDLRTPRALATVLPHLHGQHGDLYRLPGKGMRLAARVRHPASGRVMEVETDEAYLQAYFGVSLDVKGGKGGRSYGRHAGLCLECEGYPDGVNVPALGDIVLRPGEVQRRTTTYRFPGEK